MVTISLKNPAEPAVLFHTEIGVEKCVGELKEKIRNEYPNNPPASAQKLIFSGRLLNDNRVLLRDILAQRNLAEPQTFHIVISRAATPPRPSAPQTAPAGYARVNQPPPPPPHARLHPHPMHPHPQPHHPQPQPHHPHAHAHHQHAVAIRLDISLMFKLGLVVFVLAQGGETDRAIMLVVGAIVLYCYLMWNAQRPQQAPAQQANGEAASESGPAPEEVQSGAVHEVQDFFVPFFLSLIPSWVPPVRIAPLEVPVGAEAVEAVVEGEPLQ